MKKISCLVFLLGMLCLAGCSKDEGEVLSEEEIARQEQDAEYNKLKSVLLGTWEAYEHYTWGWGPISSTHRNSYTFNSDGTYIERLIIGDEKGTYRLEKNPKYPEYTRFMAKVFLYLKKDGSTYESDYILDLDDSGLLRICQRTFKSDRIPDPSDGGTAAIRYKKK